MIGFDPPVMELVIEIILSIGPESNSASVEHFQMDTIYSSQYQSLTKSLKSLYF